MAKEDIDDACGYAHYVTGKVADASWFFLTTIACTIFILLQLALPLDYPSKRSQHGQQKPHL